MNNNLKGWKIEDIEIAIKKWNYLINFLNQVTSEDSREQIPYKDNLEFLNQLKKEKTRRKIM